MSHSLVYLLPLLFLPNLLAFPRHRIPSLPPLRTLSEVTGSKPNIIILFADDMGYGDLPFYGHPTTSAPNLWQLSREGLTFTQWYSGADVCSPSRAALTTGRLPIRSGTIGEGLGLNHVFNCDATGGLPLNETTFAEIAKTVGYSTGMIGKWHLGQQPQFMPTKRGFDTYVGLPYSVDMGCPREDVASGNCTPPTSTYCYGLPLFQNSNVYQQPAQIEDLAPFYASNAQQFIKTNAISANPFLLYVAFQHVHVTVSQQENSQYSSPAFYHVSRRGRFGDALEELDWVVGEIVSTLKNLQIENNTIILFTSDNGPWMNQGLGGGSPGILSGLYGTVTYGYADTGKGSTWEGGFREPGLAWWPGTIQPATTTQEVVTTMDIFPTILDLIGVTLPTDRIYDGKSILPLLLGTNQTTPHDYIFYWRTNYIFAARQAKGPYKIHYYTKSGYGADPTVNHTSNPLIFNVEADPSERFALSNTSTEYLSALLDLNNAVAKHLATITSVPNQMGGNDPSLSICCDRTSNPPCTCGPNNSSLSVSSMKDILAWFV